VEKLWRSFLKIKAPKITAVGFVSVTGGEKFERPPPAGAEKLWQNRKTKTGKRFCLAPWKKFFWGGRKDLSEVDGLP